MKKIFAAIGALLFNLFALTCAFGSGRSHLAPGEFPTLQQFRDYFTAQKGMEIIYQPLYDTALYPTAGQTVLPFFATPRAQGLSAQPGNANAVKDINDTNMVLAGQLQRGQAFFIDNVGIDFQPGAVSTANTFTIQIPSAFAAANAAAVQAGAHDVNAFYTAGGLSLVIGTKPYLNDAPLLKFPPPFRFELDVALSSTSATAGENVKEKLKAGGMLYRINPGLSITDGQAFSVNLTWPVAVATPSGFNGSAKVMLGGWLARPVQ